ncbi:MAG: hypothetical protein QM690_10875 [Sphingobium sp.]
MVADLTRFSACTVHPDTPEKPVPEPKAEQRRQAEAPRPDPSGEEPVRLFVWASA